MRDLADLTLEIEISAKYLKNKDIDYDILKDHYLITRPLITREDIQIDWVVNNAKHIFFQVSRVDLDGLEMEEEIDTLSYFLLTMELTFEEIRELHGAFKRHQDKELLKRNKHISKEARVWLHLN